jgi:hypothetical protein
MKRLFYPCRIGGPASDEWRRVVIRGPNASAQGGGAAEALIEAAEIPQEVLDDAARDGQSAPAQDAPRHADFPRIWVIQALEPARAA